MRCASFRVVCGAIGYSIPGYSPDLGSFDVDFVLVRLPWAALLLNELTMIPTTTNIAGATWTNIEVTYK